MDPNSTMGQQMQRDIEETARLRMLMNREIAAALAPAPAEEGAFDHQAHIEAHDAKLAEQQAEQATTRTEESKELAEHVEKFNAAFPVPFVFTDPLPDAFPEQEPPAVQKVTGGAEHAEG